MYVELNCKSNFSFLRGASDAREYVRRAVELGMPALGICDINGVYGLPRAYEVVRDEAPGFKLLCGAEIVFESAPPVTFLVKSRKAWGMLCRLITQAHQGKPKGEGRLSLSELRTLAENFEGHRDLILLLKNDPNQEFESLAGLFDKNNIYLTLCRSLDGLDERRTRQALELCERYRLQVVATNEVCYHDAHRRPLQDCLTCIREGVTLDEAGFRLFGNSERFLKSPGLMAELFRDLPEAVVNTVRIAEQCRFSLEELKYTYPKEAVPPGHTAASYLRELVMRGAREKYSEPLPPPVSEQIEKELAFFSRRGEEDYFLTIYDILQEARDRKIVFQGRGSAASSIVCYSLGITAVEPISNQLLFDRFANDARPDPPDIDIDFEHERREEVIQGIYSRYTRERAAMVGAVHTYRWAGAYRELCKALGVEVGTLKAKEVEARFAELSRDKAARGACLDSLLAQISGFPRHLGTHSGGFLITHEPLFETVPVEPAAMDGRTIVQWDKHDLETLKMMKIDILSIGFLTAVRKTTEMLGMDWRKVPTQDEATYKLIQSAKTAGCFQIESRAQMSSLPHTKPSTPYEMTIQVALIRPSMSIGGMNRAYLRARDRSRRGFPFRSGHPAMDEILGRTHGVAMFPDQIMQIAMEVCEWSSAEADQLRRAFGQERSARSLDSQGEKLFQAMVAKGVSRSLAADIMKRTQGFASYGFPEAHAASYGALAFKSAYLKVHHPAEYLCGLINSQPMGFYSVDFLLNEAVRESGVRVLPVHPLRSDWDARMEGPKTLRMGFRNLRGLSEEEVREMMDERRRRPFESVEDFIARTPFEKRILHHLAMANAFECFGLDRRHSFWKSLEFKALLGQRGRTDQLSLFDEATKLETGGPVFAGTTELEEAVLDYRLLGYSLKGSLMRQLRLELPSLPPTHSALIRGLRHRTRVRVAGLLMVDQRPPPAKGFGFLTLEDEHGTLDLVLPPNVYDGHKSIFRLSRFLVVSGEVQRLDDQVTIKVSAVESFAPRNQIRSHQPHPRLMSRPTW